MAPTRTEPRVFTIATGEPFLDVFARTLLAGEIIPGFPDPAHPFAIASARVFVPTRRAARALAEAFARTRGGRAGLLPQIIPLGRIETLEPDFGDDDFLSGVIETPVVSEFERRLGLARLVRKWARDIRVSVLAMDTAGQRRLEGEEPVVVATSLAAAWSLAGDLGALIDEFAIEGVDWSRLDTLVPDQFDEYWRLTHGFLRIAVDAWPRHLEERGLLDRAEHQIRLVSAIIDTLPRRSDAGPLIALGSTGANAATARLLNGIARLPNGAILLPGLDLDLDEGAWSLLRAASDPAAEPLSTHPQATMARLLNSMGVSRDAVIELGAPTPALRARNHLLSEAMRPAETTDAWRDLRVDGALSAMLAGLDGIVVVDAADEREEAICVAIRLRECIEHDKRAALITPDRDIARRVAAHLGRWGVDIADSAGDPLRRTPFGSHARQVLDAVSADASGVAIATLLSHPLTNFGLEADEASRLARLVDLAILRGGAGLADDPADTVARARQRVEDRDAHLNARALGDDDWSGITRLLDTMRVALAPLRDAPPALTIAEWAARHLRAVTASRLADAEAEGGAGLDELFDEFIGHGDDDAIGFDEYVTLFDQACVDVVARPDGDDGRVRILGLLEARLLDFDVAIVAGLDEGVRPPRASADAFLNCSMRASLGMSAPERRIGQTAHDFTRALGAPEAVIVRARKRGGAPTTPSRFVQRLAALVGEETWRTCVARGDELISLARRLDERPMTPISPPRPAPPVEMRPLSFSVTRVETLRRDPYSIYAERVLRLAPMPSLDVELGARDYGTALHATISTFSPLLGIMNAPDARDRLLDIARAEFAAFFQLPGFKEFKWPSVIRVLNAWLDFERERAPDIADRDFERAGVVKIPLRDGAVFELTARADRIETWIDGSSCILDFKTGRPPTAREINAGFAPQLVLEAWMLAHGGFGPARGAEIRAEYIKLGGPDDLGIAPVGEKDMSLVDLAREQFDGLATMLNEMRDPERPFLSRPYPQFASRYGDYDHLARVKEWAAEQDDGDAG